MGNIGGLNIPRLVVFSSSLLSQISGRASLMGICGINSFSFVLIFMIRKNYGVIQGKRARK